MPPLSASQSLDGYRIFDLDRLITMKLTAFPGKGRPHPRDMIDVGLVDAATQAMPGGGPLRSVTSFRAMSSASSLRNCSTASADAEP